VNGFLKGGLALGGAVVALGALRRAFNPRHGTLPGRSLATRSSRTRFSSWVAGSEGFTAANEICDRTKEREDVGVLVVAKDNFFTFWPMVAGIVSSDIDSRNVAQPLRRALITAGASFRRSTLNKIDPENQTITVDGGVSSPTTSS
jgi:NADH dehydrogenase